MNPLPPRRLSRPFVLVAVVLISASTFCGWAQNFYLPTPYPTETVTPTPTPATLAIGEPFPVLNSVVINPREKSEAEKKEELRKRRYIRNTEEEVERLSLADLKNKPVLVYFWLSKSPVSVEEIPYLLDLYDKYHGVGLDVVGVSLDFRRSEAEDFIREWGIPWPVLWEEDGWNSSLARELHVHALPCNFLLSRSHVLRAKDLRGEALEDAVVRLTGSSRKAAPSPLVRIKPSHPEPGSEFTVDYQPRRESHRLANKMDVAIQPGTPSNQWDFYSMKKGADSRRNIVWTARIPFPADQVRERLYIGPKLKGLPPRVIQKSLNVYELLVDSATYEQIVKERNEAENAEAKGDWVTAARHWLTLFRIRPFDPLNYARAILGLLRDATHDRKAGNPQAIVGQIPRISPLPDRRSTEVAVRESLEPGQEKVDPWLARGAAVLMIEASKLTTASLTNSYVDTYAWALYKAGFPDRALDMQDNIAIPYLFQDPALGMRKVLYQIDTGKTLEGKRLYRQILARCGSMLHLFPDLKKVQEMVFHIMPEKELLAGDVGTTETLPGEKTASAEGTTTASMTGRGQPAFGGGRPGPGYPGRAIRVPAPTPQPTPTDVFEGGIPIPRDLSTTETLRARETPTPTGTAPSAATGTTATKGASPAATPSQ